MANTKSTAISLSLIPEFCHVHNRPSTPHTQLHLQPQGNLKVSKCSRPTAEYKTPVGGQEQRSSKGQEQGLEMDDSHSLNWGPRIQTVGRYSSTHLPATK